MTDIEKQALALVNEEPGYNCCHLGEVSSQLAIKVLLRALEMLNAEREAHAATKRDMSDAVEAMFVKEMG